jgi:hypothetical protein
MQLPVKTVPLLVMAEMDLSKTSLMQALVFSTGLLLGKTLYLGLFGSDDDSLLRHSPFWGYDFLRRCRLEGS